MGRTRVTPASNSLVAQGKDIVRIPDQTGEFIAPHMCRDMHVIITRPEVVAPGLRLGDWSQVDVPDVETQAVGS